MTPRRQPIPRRPGADDFAYLAESGNGYLATWLGQVNSRPIGRATFHMVPTGLNSRIFGGHRWSSCSNLDLDEDWTIELVPKVARLLGRVCRDCLLIATTGEPANRQRYAGDPLGVAFHWTPEQRRAISERQRSYMDGLGPNGRMAATAEARRCNAIYRDRQP